MKRLSSIICLPVLLVICAASADAQPFAWFFNKQAQALKGPVETVKATTRSWSNELNQWLPLTATTMMKFDRNGDLLVSAIYYSSPQHDVERLFNYRKKGVLNGYIERFKGTGSVLKHAYSYDLKEKLEKIVTRDSATDRIVRLEAFTYENDGSIFSRIREFDPEVTKLTDEKDTAGLRADASAISFAKVTRDTLVSENAGGGFGDTKVVLINYFRWWAGNDSLVDRLEITRYREDGTIFATIRRTFEGGRERTMTTSLYNDVLHVSSSAASVAPDETIETAYIYAYEMGEHGNWSTARQYMPVYTSEGVQPEEKKLLWTTERQITYYEN